MNFDDGYIAPPSDEEEVGGTKYQHPPSSSPQRPASSYNPGHRQNYPSNNNSGGGNDSQQAAEHNSRRGQDGGGGGGGSGGGRRVRGSAVWSTTEQDVEESGSSARGGIPQHRGGKKRRQTAFDHAVESAIQYRAIMQQLMMNDDGGTKNDDCSVNPSLLQPAEQSHLDSLVLDYLQSCGLDSAAAALEIRNGIPYQFVDAEQTTTFSASSPHHSLQTSNHHQLALLVNDAVNKANELFDDDRAWSSEHLVASSSSSIELVDIGKGCIGGSVDLLVEKLFLVETDTPMAATLEQGSTSLGPMTNTKGVATTDTNSERRRHHQSLEGHFTNVFLLLNPLFVSPDALLSRCTKLYKTLSLQQVIVGPQRVNDVQTRILMFLLAWIRVGKYELPLLALERAVAFAVNCTTSSELYPTVAKAARKLLIVSREAVGYAQHALSGGRPFDHRELHDQEGGYPHTATYLRERLPPPPPPLVSNDAKIDTLTDIPEVEAARQLSLLTFSLFAEIRPRELLHGAWMHTPLKPTTRNLTNYVDFLRKLTAWIVSLMSTAGNDGSQRMAVHNYCVRLMKELFDLQNFAAAAAVLEAIDHSKVNSVASGVSSSAAVSGGGGGLRLSHTDHETLEVLREALNPFAPAPQPTNMATATVPRIQPFLATLCRTEESLKTFVIEVVRTRQKNSRSRGDKVAEEAETSEELVEAECEDEEEEGLSGETMVNWSKITTIGTALLKLMSLQLVGYPFTVHPKIQLIMWHMPGLDASVLD